MIRGATRPDSYINETGEDLTFLKKKKQKTFTSPWAPRYRPNLDLAAAAGLRSLLVLSSEKNMLSIQRETAIGHFAWLAGCTGRGAELPRADAAARSIVAANVPHSVASGIFGR